jgi:hypothetical protein
MTLLDIPIIMEVIARFMALFGFWLFVGGLLLHLVAGK